MEAKVRMMIIEVLDVSQNRFRFDGKCISTLVMILRRDGRPQHGNCEGCKSLYVIHLYTKIANRRAENENGILVRTSSGREGPRAIDEFRQLSNTENK